MFYRYLPRIGIPGNASSTICIPVFAELDKTLALLDSVRKDLNPVQRQLVHRFIASCKVFGREIIAADSDPNAPRAAFGFSAADKPISLVDTPAAGRAMIEDICSSTCVDLENIGGSLQDGLINGVADIIASIRAEQEEGAPHCEALDAIISSVRYLAHQIAVLFEVKISVLRGLQLIHQAESENINVRDKDTCRVSADEFMKAIKPPVRRVTFRERIEPYIPHLTQLRDSGYSYAQCAQFLRENGIDAKPATISNTLHDALIRVSDPKIAQSDGGNAIVVQPA
jgi:hypothetical protein